MSHLSICVIVYACVGAGCIHSVGFLFLLCVRVSRSDHPLAQLYCHSTMEHHHFDQCLMILNSPVGALAHSVHKHAQEASQLTHLSCHHMS